MHYFPIIEPLVIPKVMPKRTRIATLTLYNGRVIKSDRYKKTETQFLIVTQSGIETPSLDCIRDIKYDDELIYPKLPSVFGEVSKSDNIGWVMFNLRVLLDECNQVSIKRYDLILSISVEHNRTTKITSLVMSGFWSILPVYVRHKWIQELWNVYTKLVTLYGADLECHRITLYPYDNPKEKIGYRSRARSWVKGGPDCHYNLVG